MASPASSPSLFPMSSLASCLFGEKENQRGRSSALFHLVFSALRLIDLLSHPHHLLVWILLVDLRPDPQRSLCADVDCAVTSRGCPDIERMERTGMQSDVLCCGAPPQLPVLGSVPVKEEKGINQLWPQEGGMEGDSHLELMRILKSKILRLRNNLDLPHLNASLTLDEKLQQLYKLLKLAGDLWYEKWCESENATIEDEVDVENVRFEQLGEVVITRLDHMNAKIKEIFDLMKNSTSNSETKDGQISMHDCGNPMSPDSVLQESLALNSNIKVNTNTTYVPPLVHPIRLQAIGKLKPIDPKGLSFHLFPLVLDQNPNMGTQTERVTDDLEVDALDACMILEPISYAEIRSGHSDISFTYGDFESPTSSPVTSPKPLAPDMQKPSTAGAHQSTCTEQNEGDSSMNYRSSIRVSPTLPLLRLRTQYFPSTPTPPPSPMVLTGIPMLFGSPRYSTMEMEPVAFAMAIDDSNHGSETSETSSSVSPPSPSMSRAPKTQTQVPPLPTSIQLHEATKPFTEQPIKSAPSLPSNGCQLPTIPPPPPLPSKDCVLLAPTPAASEGVSLMRLSSSLPSPKVPAPPPPMKAAKLLHAKKTGTKLKRSAQMGYLYRVLKGKVEGSSLDGKTFYGRKNQTGNSSGDRTKGMADALAEMTKRSAYFRQIEEDVEKHSASILEMRSSLCSFETKDMKELLKFHQYMEQKLEHLTDETQVLARFEGFPFKKLDTIRMAVALHRKLESIVMTLKGWRLASPVCQQLDKVECYFNKIKQEVDVIERSKEEESKRFKTHKIEFDFAVLVRIKESMVDLSSDCIEMALTESRQTKEMAGKTTSKSRGLSKMLWRAFQLSFRVYNFAGGQDDRADKLTKELAHEIETCPQF
ncbi:hypothetical protein Cni_G05265 [Canna indica]|uniref:Hydroxyproline-rich glycoprotein family protein n=1 Tax=Canna indica TaxID=4628 RepID=A0AAQ3JU81_9LILI|nr:hypothetical protein Cni_G05265 [Canna indica]